MSKSNAYLVLCAMVICVGLSWFLAFKGENDSTAEYRKYMEKAAILEEQGIYVDALQFYDKALELSPNDYSLTVKVADMYLNLKKTEEFVKRCNKAIKMEPLKEEAYIHLIDYYVSRDMISEMGGVLKALPESLRDQEPFAGYLADFKTRYYDVLLLAEEVGDWYYFGDQGYLKIVSKGKVGLVDSKAKRKIQARYDDLGVYDPNEKVLPVKLDGEYYFGNSKCEKKIPVYFKYNELRGFGSGWAPAKKGNRFVYINRDYEEHGEEFQDASCFFRNVAAVKKDGKWALIDPDFNQITDYIYDEVVMDSNYYCSLFPSIIVKEGGKYYLVDLTGKRLTQTGYDEIALPASSDEYVAVRENDLWGFIDPKNNYEIAIRPLYKEAKSFALGFAPVYNGEKWGYINTDCEVVIPYSFDDAKVFSRYGSAAVKKRTEWNLIRLYSSN
ncbi:MAG: WG repeat-containing protein [Lachnospiraceae bacterium]|nr:WG repeat-containing protein [Lachnospiraceae bacterium]